MSAMHGHPFDPRIFFIRDEFDDEEEFDDLDDEDFDDLDDDDDDLDDDLDEDDDDLDFDDDDLDDDDLEAEYEELYENDESYTSRRRRSGDWE